MLNKSEICVIVGGYPQNHQDTALLSLTIESFKRYGYDICLVSHSPINNDLQKASKYTIYSDENYSPLIIRAARPVPPFIARTTGECKGSDL